MIVIVGFTAGKTQYFEFGLGSTCLVFTSYKDVTVLKGESVTKEHKLEGKLGVHYFFTSFTGTCQLNADWLRPFL